MYVGNALMAAKFSISIVVINFPVINPNLFLYHCNLVTMYCLINCVISIWL